MAAQAKYNGFSSILILIVILFVGILVGGGYYMGKLQAQNTTPTSIPSMSSNPTMSALLQAQPTSVPLAESNVAAGTVTGILCYPSEGIPAGTIVAKRLEDKAEFTQENPPNNGQFELDLPVGTYHVKYVVSKNLVGYYTACSGGDAACNDPARRSSLPVVVNADEQTTNVKICDYYYPPGKEPTF